MNIIKCLLLVGKTWWDHTIFKLLELLLVLIKGIEIPKVEES